MMRDCSNGVEIIPIDMVIVEWVIERVADVSNKISKSASEKELIAEVRIIFFLFYGIHPIFRSKNWFPTKMFLLIAPPRPTTFLLPR